MCSRKNHIKLRATATSPSLLPFVSPSNRSLDLTCLSSYHQGIKAWTTSAFSLAKWEKYLNLNRITLITPQKPKKKISPSGFDVFIHENPLVSGFVFLEGWMSLRNSKNPPCLELMAEGCTARGPVPGYLWRPVVSIKLDRFWLYELTG